MGTLPDDSMGNPCPSAVHYDDVGNPQLELTAAEWILPMTFDQGAGDVRVNFHVKPYRAVEMKRMLNAAGHVYSSEGGVTLNVAPGNRESCRHVFDANFIRMSGDITTPDGAEPGRDEQIAFLNANPQIKEDVILNGLGGFELLPTDDPDATTGRFVLATTPARPPIRLRMKLVNADGRVEEIRIDHDMDQESATDRFKYGNATGRRQINTRRAEVRAVEDYDVIEELYDRLIRHVSGVALRGQVCTEVNRADWIPKIPFWHKSVVVDEVFRRGRVKNA